MNTVSGPLFAGPPGAHGIPWLHVLPVLIAAPAVPLLLWGLWRGRLSPAVGVFAVALPVAASLPRFRAVEAHQDPDLQKALVAREMSCTGTCHPAAHPDSALTGGKAAS